MKKKYKVDGETKEIVIADEKDMEENEELENNKGEDNE